MSNPIGAVKDEGLKAALLYQLGEAVEALGGDGDDLGQFSAGGLSIWFREPAERAICARRDLERIVVAERFVYPVQLEARAERAGHWSLHSAFRANEVLSRDRSGFFRVVLGLFRVPFGASDAALSEELGRRGLGRPRLEHLLILSPFLEGGAEWRAVVRAPGVHVRYAVGGVERLWHVHASFQAGHAALMADLDGLPPHLSPYHSYAIGVLKEEPVEGV